MYQNRFAINTSESIYGSMSVLGGMSTLYFVSFGALNLNQAERRIYDKIICKTLRTIL